MGVDRLARLLVAAARQATVLVPRPGKPRTRRAGDGGYSTETVVVTALLVLLALAALAVLTTKVLAKINSVDLG